MALRAAVLHHDRRQPLQIDREQLHHRRLARHQHLPLAGRVRRLARPQPPQHAVKDILDVVHALLEERRRELLEGGDVLVERVEQGGLGRGAAAEAGGQVALDGAVLEDHQLGVEDRAVVLADQLRDALAEADDLVAGLLHRRVQPDLFALRVVALARHDPPPLVEAVHDVGLADADAGAERDAAEGGRPRLRAAAARAATRGRRPTPAPAGGRRRPGTATWAATVTSIRTSFCENVRGSMFWTTRTPCNSPPSRSGTPRKEWYGSSPASGKYLKRGCWKASATMTGAIFSAVSPVRPSSRRMRTWPTLSRLQPDGGAEDEFALFGM